MTLVQDSKSEMNCNLQLRPGKAGHLHHTRHLMLQYCTRCKHDWPGAGLSGGPSQPGGNETHTKTENPVQSGVSHW